MITSFFKTSKPIHYIIFSIVLISLFFHQRIFVSDFESTIQNYLKEGACLLVVIASFFVLIFIVTKNNITQNNSFAALFFCLFVGVFPQILDYTSTLIANLFILLSLRRIVSLKNKANIKKKILDATLWICLATLFDSFSIFFFIPLILGLALYSVFEIKNILIPLFGIFAFVNICTSISFVAHDQLPNIYQYLPRLSFEVQDFILKKRTRFSLFITIIIIFGIINYFLSGFFKNRFNRPSLVLLIFIIVVSFGAFLCSQEESNELYIFVVAPLAILIANFSETAKFRWMKDLIIVSLFIVTMLQIPFNIF
tara:strand:+ start:22434 stop:23366 length:933 start_codon:yes stop_codon:yes gene_type:complete